MSAQEVFQQLYASSVVRSARELFVEPVKLFGTTENASQIDRTSSELFERRAQESGSAHGCERCQQHGVAFAVFVGSQNFSWSGERRRRCPPISIEATSSPERKRRNRAGIRQVYVAMTGRRLDDQEAFDEWQQGAARNLFKNSPRPRLLHTPPERLLVREEAICAPALKASHDAFQHLLCNWPARSCGHSSQSNLRFPAVSMENCLDSTVRESTLGFLNLMADNLKPCPRQLFHHTPALLRCTRRRFVTATSNFSGTNQTVAVTRPGRPYIGLAKLAKFPLREWNAGHGRFAFYCGTWAFPVTNLHECDKVALLA
jgi:hypothetical protein